MQCLVHSIQMLAVVFSIYLSSMCQYIDIHIDVDIETDIKNNMSVCIFTILIITKEVYL